MNEVLIKSIIKYKLATADKLLQRLPSNLSNNIKSFNSIVYEVINENLKDNSCVENNKANTKGKLNKIDIE